MVWQPLLLVLWAVSTYALSVKFSININDEASAAQIPVLGTSPNTVNLKAIHASPAADNLPTVDLGYTRHKAVANPINPSVYKFQSIRYAQPPVGDLRFKAPQPPKDGPSREVEDGSGKKECLQATVKWAENFPEDTCEGCECCVERNEEDGSCKTTCSDEQRNSLPTWKSMLGGLLPDLTDPKRYSEDCLYLDVYSPKEVFEGEDKVPVMVWIYGGAYVFGGKTLYNPAGLMTRSLIEDRGGMVFVTMNYRTGALGFAAGKDIADKDINAGLLDQQQALRWVKQHIAKFGGDPDYVTIAGLSAGGGSVIHHLTAYGGASEERLFHQALSLSGGWQPVTNKTSAENTFQDFMKLAGAKTTEELRKIPEDKIRQANFDQINKAPPGTFLYNPIAWGDFSPESPSKLLANYKFKQNVKLIMSHTLDEGSKFTTAFQDRNTSLEEFVRLALPDLDEDEREWVLDVYQTDEPDYVDIGNVIGDVTFRCPVTYVSDAMHGGLYRQRWGTVKSKGHGGDLMYLFYRPLMLVRSIRSAHILQDYAVTFTMFGVPFTTVENPPGYPQPVNYSPHYLDRKVQNLGSGLLNVPIVKREDPEFEYVCRVWQSIGST